MNSSSEQTLQNSQIVDQFIELFKELLRYHHPQDRFEDEGQFVMRKSVSHWVELKQPIKCLLPAFPFKSTNKEKVFGVLPDRGEQIAIDRLEYFCNEVGKIYEFGCKILIVTDGRVYADLVNAEYHAVQAYRNAILERFNSSPCFEVTNVLAEMQNSINDEFGTSIEDDPTAQMLMEKFGTTDEDVDQAIRTDPNLKVVYLAFLNWLRFELGPWKDNTECVTRNAVKRRCKYVAREMIKRNIAYSSVLKSRYPHHVRFSIHGHDNSQKFGIRMFPGSQCITPWHNTVCKMLDGRIVLLKTIVVQYLNVIQQLEQEKAKNKSKEEIEVPFLRDTSHLQDKRNHKDFIAEAKRFNAWSKGSNCSFRLERTESGQPWQYIEDKKPIEEPVEEPTSVRDEKPVKEECKESSVMTPRTRMASRTEIIHSKQIHQSFSPKSFPLMLFQILFFAFVSPLMYLYLV